MFYRILVATLLFTASLFAQPNIVLIVADDLGYGETGAQGNAEIPTPHIDSIAENGVRFTQGYVTAPYCSASRAALMAGRYQTRFGYEFNPVGAYNEDPDAGLPTSERTLADELRDSGYLTGIFGKWHLGGHAKFHPLRRGFDDFFGFLHEGHYFVPPPYEDAVTWERRKTLPGGGEGLWTSADGRRIYSTHMRQNEPAYDANNPILRGGQPVDEPENLTDAFTREANRFIERNADRPFFLYLPYNAVHSPLQADDAYMAKFEHIDNIQRRIFAAMLAQMDDAIGRVLSTLHDQGLKENTLVFFISDNGGPTKELTSSNAPLREGKGSLYEGGIRVPFLAQWPGTLASGTTYDRPVTSLDIHATALSLAGNEPTSPDGVDLIPYLTGEQADEPHDQLFWRMGNKAAIRIGDLKLVKNPTRGNADATWELYNLATDQSESQNLASSHPEDAERLLKAWKQMNAEMIQPTWSPRR